MLGKTLNDFFICNTSLAFRLPQKTLPLNLSKSYTSYKLLRNSSLNKNSLFYFSTISNLSFFNLISLSGCNIIFFNVLAPIAVLVLSINHIKLYCLSFNLYVSNNSRLCVVCISIFK